MEAAENDYQVWSLLKEMEHSLTNNVYNKVAKSSAHVETTAD